MRVDFVVPAVLPESFSAGIYAITRFANGLAGRGHDVRLVSAGLGHPPEWIDLEAQLVAPDASPGRVLRGLMGATAAYARGARSGGPAGEAFQARIRELIRALSPHSASDAQRRGGELERLRGVLGDADVTIATLYSTVVPVYLYGGGHLVHFAQNYEPWFSLALEDQVLARAEARLAHSLPLHRITIVEWVAEILKEHHGETAQVCHLGIDHRDFYPDGSPPEQPFTVVTPGGRGLTWKGFPEAVEAIAIARREVPGLRWRVYGGADPGPDNPVAPYEDVGFLRPPQLRPLYSTAHVTLCPSRFEAFPIPPLEAMACGSPVITTPYGGADVVEEGRNATVVPAGDPDAMAQALVRLWRDPELRAGLADQGLQTAAKFTWEPAIDRFEGLIVDLCAGPRLTLEEAPPPDLESVIGMTEPSQVAGPRQASDAGSRGRAADG